MKRSGFRIHYLRAGKKYPSLANAEIEELIKRAQSGEPGATDARNHVAVSFIPLVLATAGQMPFHGDPHLFDALVGVGNETLLKAVAAFDFSPDLTFYAYLSGSLKKEMYSYLLCRGGHSRQHTFWIPRNTRRHVVRVAREWEKTGRTGDPPLAFIQDCTHVKASTAEIVLSGWKASLRERQDIVSEFEIDFVDRSSDAIDARDSVAFALQVLNDKESDLIRRRWLTPGEFPSLRQIDREDGLTYGMSLYFEQKAFTKMREALCA